MSLQFGILGCGLIGWKRANALGDHRLVACADPDLARAEKLASSAANCAAYSNAERVLEHPGVDAVIVAATNHQLAPLTMQAVRSGKHVLVEKPGCIHSSELREIRAAAEQSSRLVKVGFNHRFHPSFQCAIGIFRQGGIGPLLHIRARYGHGGRLGYDREWRADPLIAGGGEMLDQGIHLIDLARWFAGDFVEVNGHVTTAYWDMPVEDNGFLSMRTANGQTAWLHASCTEWKNLFSFELFGRDGKLQIDGLGGSYGVERLTHYRMLPELGPPETTIWEYPFADHSWARETAYFAERIAANELQVDSVNDAIAAMEIVEALYERSGRDYHP